jgi:hypothetical protein
MMRIPWTLLMSVGFCLANSAEVHAQPLFGSVESIESTVANADLVLVGKIVEVGPEQKDSSKGHEVVLAVEQTLKQDIFQTEPFRRLRLVVHLPKSVLAKWKDRSTRLLMIVTTELPADSTTVIDLTPDSLQVLTADFRLLRDPKAVIEAARETVRRMPVAVKRIHTFGLVVPREVVVGTEWEKYYKTGGSLGVSVPVDARLEKWACDAIRSATYGRREEGVRALRYFKSKENVARVKGLLNDPGWAYLKHPQENNGIEVRVYGVRQEAYRTLKSWGIDVEKPTIREELRR